MLGGSKCWRVLNVGGLLVLEGSRCWRALSVTEVQRSIAIKFYLLLSD